MTNVNKLTGTPVVRSIADIQRMNESLHKPGASIDWRGKARPDPGCVDYVSKLIAWREANPVEASRPDCLVGTPLAPIGDHWSNR